MVISNNYYDINITGSKYEGFVSNNGFGGFWLPGCEWNHWLAITGGEVYKQKWSGNACG
jgi:hypothetical protein